MLKTYIVSYASTAVVFLALDGCWLTVMGSSVYRATLGDVLLEKFNIGVAIAFYLLYVLGIVIFAVTPALGAQQWATSLRQGALFGFFAYATYDLTNLATLRNWTLSLALTDLCWGTFATAASALVAYLVTSAVS